MGSVASIISAASTGAQTGFAFGQHQADAQAASLRGRFENDVAERNAKLAEMQRADVLNRGAFEENRFRGEVDQQVSSGRAAAAASGVDVSTGSAADVSATRSAVGELDALTLRNNAAREAWGYDVQAANSRMEGRLALLAGENEAAGQRAAGVSTLLTGASSLASQYYRTRTKTTIDPGATTGRVTAPVVNRGRY